MNLIGMENTSIVLKFATIQNEPKRAEIGNMKTPTRRIATRMIPTIQFPPGKISTQLIVTPGNCNPRNLTKFNDI